MPAGSGGQMCADVSEVKAMLRTDPDYAFEIVVTNPKPGKRPSPLVLSFNKFEANKTALQDLFAASENHEVAVQWPPCG